MTLTLAQAHTPHTHTPILNDLNIYLNVSRISFLCSSIEIHQIMFQSKNSTPLTSLEIFLASDQLSFL